jgi:hypothetical protein
MKGNFKIPGLAFVVVLVLQMWGCAAPPVMKTPGDDFSAVLKPPSALNIRLVIRDWEVQSHRVLDYNHEWGLFRMSGRYDYLGDLVMKLKSEKFPGHYWLVQVPSVKEGAYEVRAIIYSEPSPELRPPSPPASFRVALLIEGGIVMNHAILDYHPGLGEFYFEGYRDGVATIRSRVFPNCRWAARMPTEDGRWTIDMVLQECWGECRKPLRS